MGRAHEDFFRAAARRRLDSYLETLYTPSMAAETKDVLLQLPPPLYVWLRERARRRSTSMSAILRGFIEANMAGDALIARVRERSSIVVVLDDDAPKRAP